MLAGPFGPKIIRKNMGNYIEIDNTKCVGCGICINECPCNCLMITDKKACLCEINNCLSCGHCGAVCPQNAITSVYDGRKHFVISEFEKNISPSQLLFCKKRSVRTFLKKEIDKNALIKMVEYAEKAPSAENLRNRKYYILNNREYIKQIVNCIKADYKKLILLLNPVTLKIVRIINKEYSHELEQLVLVSRKIVTQEKNNDIIFRDSNCIVCIAAPERSLFSRDDCIGAQHYMMLYGKTINIDSFIVGFAQSVHKKIEHILKIPKGYSIYAISAFGYSKYEFVKDIKYTMPDISFY
jgi:ferredoxin